MVLDVCDLSRSVILSLNEPSRYSQSLQKQKQILAESYLFLCVIIYHHYRLLLLTHTCCRSGYYLKTPDQVIREFSFTAYSRLYQWRREKTKTSSQSCHRPEQHRVTSIASRTVGYLYELCIHLDRPLLKYFAIPHGSPALDTVGEHINLNAPM
jgi:hypothetical protein